MSTIFSASNFTIVTSTNDFTGSFTNSVMYTVPSGKYADFYIRNLRSIAQFSNSVFVRAGFDDGVGGIIASENAIVVITQISPSGNFPAGAHVISPANGAIITTAPTATTSANAHSLTLQGYTSVSGSIYGQLFGVRHPPVRLLAGDRIVVSAGVNPGGTLRIVWKAIEYSST